MNRLALNLFVFTLFIFIGTSCAGGIPTAPGDPDISGASYFESKTTASHHLWGYYQIAIDRNSGTAEVVPLRQGEMHANVVTFLQPPSDPGLGVEILNTSDFSTGRIDVNVSITHPFPNKFYTGFDVRGIFIAPGTSVSGADNSIVYCAPNEARLLNADGYTRWWNPSEFPATGILGFTNGILGTSVAGYLTTLNPYKVFADYLTPQDTFDPPAGNRLVFSAAQTNTRFYQLKFKTVGSNPLITFNYAIDASWVEPQGDPNILGSFPITANMPEPYLIKVTDNGSTAYYDPDTELSGGTLKLQVKIYRHGGATNPSWAVDELENIQIESQTLFSSVYEYDPALTAVDGDAAVLDVNIPATPTTDQNPEILVSVLTIAGAYDQGFGSPAPDNTLGAYNLVSAPIYSGIPVAAAPVIASINTIRDANKKITGLQVEWDDVEGANEYLVYSCADPYEVSGPITYTLDTSGTFMGSSWEKSITGADQNGQWLLYVTARTEAGMSESESGPSNVAFADLECFEPFVQQNGNIWRIRRTDDSTTQRFVYDPTSGMGIEGSGALALSPKTWFRRDSLTYCVTPRLPTISGVSECTFEFSHRRTENFPFDIPMGQYRYGYSVGSSPTVHGDPAVQYYEFPFTQQTYDAFDIITSTDEMEGEDPLNSYVEGLDYRYNTGWPTSSAYGWTGLAMTDFAFERFNIPGVITDDDDFVGICFAGPSLIGSPANFVLSVDSSIYSLYCDEFAVLIW